MTSLWSDSLFLGAIPPSLMPMGWVAIGMFVAAALLVGAIVAIRFAAPKTSAIAWTTGKEVLWQPFFYVLLGLGTVALLLFVFLPYFTLGDDVKVVKETGLTLLMVLSMVLAVWTASVSIADEIEGRTALTVLSKPIGRRQFILGKFLGILGPVAILFIVLGGIFLGCVSYKVQYEARETAQPEPTSEQCLAEVVQIAPGLPLAWMETMVLASIAVAVSTRLSLVPNLVLCTAVYVLGNLVPMLVNSSVGQSYPIVQFVAELLATILPGLENFDIYGAISTGRAVPLIYLVWAGVYCLLFTTVMMLVALLLFEDRDLA
jgi:ABC-type transport system involved in multi-copper enzyme maturation permease subunit